MYVTIVMTNGKINGTIVTIQMLKCDSFDVDGLQLDYLSVTTVTFKCDDCEASLSQF